VERGADFLDECVGDEGGGAGERGVGDDLVSGQVSRMQGSK